MGGAGSVTIAANKGIKMDIARKVEAADHYIELERDRDAAKKQWAQIKEENPCMSFIAQTCGVERWLMDRRFRRRCRGYRCRVNRQRRH
jgi:D-arabinitol dehydrogenase (NADP+)